MGFVPWYREIVSGQTTGAVAHLLRGLLTAGEPAYGVVVRLKNRRFDSGRVKPTKVAAPVVSVGNLTVGGTGKTPLVCWLAEWFQSRGAAVALISRGYGARRGQPNDEALELAARLPDVPHLQNPDRVAAAQEALRVNPRQVLLLDDAFQHRRIARDLDIVLLDALAPFGYDRLLPRGLLREPVESLARAQVIAVSRADAVDQAARQAIFDRVRKVARHAVWLELEHRPVALVSTTGDDLPLDHLRGHPVAAFCGIGNPDGFRHTLASCGLSVVDFRALPDHFAYPPAQLAKLADWVGRLKDIAAVVCTRKDLVKIPRAELGGRQLLALDVRLAITVGEDDLVALLEPLAARASGG